MIKCRRCEKTVRRSIIVSMSEGSEYFKICGPCAGEMDYMRLQQDIKRNEALKRRNAQITSKIQRATAEAKTPEEVREKTQKIISDEELQERAREELAVRELCRRSLLDFIFRFKSNYQAGWVHRVICRQLEKFLDDVANKRSPRLMIFMPPRHGKSEIVSDKFPSWVLGKHPHMEIMLASYAVTLATGFSKVNRDRVRDPVYQQIFPDTKIDPDDQGAELWKTTQRGGFLAAGVGGPITGRGADIFIVDDPVKNYEEAESETIRESIKNWWRSTARTRLSPGGGVLVVQTRWHDDDLSGFLEREYIDGVKDGIPESELEKFDIISFPAIAEENEYVDRDWNVYYDHTIPEGRKVLHVRKPGDPLHPARYSAAYLNQSRRSMGNRMFGALYQQNPVPDSGDFFRASDFRYYNQVPHMGPRPVFFAWDLAMSQKQSGDFSVGVAAMYNERGEVHILELLRGRWRTAELLANMVSLVERYRNNLGKLGIEQGVIWNSVKDEFYKQLQKKNLYITTDDSLRPMTDKRTRARPLQAWMQSGKLHFPTSQPWVEQARSELLRFDAGVNDDVVDALAWLVRMLQNEPVPDIHRLRKARDGFYVGRDKLIADYMRAQHEDAAATKRFMSS